MSAAKCVKQPGFPKS